MDPISVELVTFYPKENAKENFTEEYDIIAISDMPTPVFRRGCTFYFAIKFSRDFDLSQDVVRVGFNFGPNPNVLKGTRIILPILPHQKQLPKDKDRWGLHLQNTNGTTAMIQVFIPPCAQVGIWTCSIQSNISGKRDKRHDFKCEDELYVLFNPWCKDDPVYMENEEERKEYVLNENGKIWCGTFKKPKGKPWIFGQFDDVILPASILLLEKSGLKHSDRGSPVLVARAISAAVNSVDDGGLLEGKWDGDYADGTSPHAWTGTRAILDQYLNTGGQAVKYGQCWVFSAATVTVCRALGIPCRSVTNYVSAHDTNCSLTIDKYFDVFGDKIENGPDGDCNDSCWNFHVWNDVWMARPDLPPGYGGWQIIDATPQELSDNAFRCGPASIEAVRKGEVAYLYDTPFVFSEVNADIVHFQEDQSSEWGFSRLSINKYHVGRKLLTKKVGFNDDKADSDLWDVTRLYKNPEGTEAERLAVYNAVKGVPKAQLYYEIPEKTKDDVFFDLVDIDSVPFGESFDVVVNIKNNSNEDRNISAVVSASSIYYTGAAAETIKKSQDTFRVKGGQEEQLKITCTPNEYMPKLVEHGLIKLYSIANVQETKQTWSEEDDFTLTKPDIKLTVGDVCKAGEDCKVSLSFKNPLNMALTNCTYTVEGPGHRKPKAIPFRDVQPNEEVSIDETFKAKRPGNRKIVVNFNSQQIQGLSGIIKIVIQK